MSTPSSLKKPSAMQSFELFKKQAKQKEERVRFQTLLVSTVEFRSLELEGTVKICLSYRKFEPPKFCNLREKKVWFWPGTVSLCYDKLMDSTVGLCCKKNMWARSLEKVLKYYLFGIFKRSLKSFFAIYFINRKYEVGC